MGNRHYVNAPAPLGGLPYPLPDPTERSRMLWNGAVGVNVWARACQTILGLPGAPLEQVQGPVQQVPG